MNPRDLALRFLLIGMVLTSTMALPAAATAQMTQENPAAHALETYRKEQSFLAYSNSIGYPRILSHFRNESRYGRMTAEQVTFTLEFLENTRRSHLEAMLESRNNLIRAYDRYGLYAERDLLVNEFDRLYAQRSSNFDYAKAYVQTYDFKAAIDPTVASLPTVMPTASPMPTASASSTSAPIPPASQAPTASPMPEVVYGPTKTPLPNTAPTPVATIVPTTPPTVTPLAPTPIVTPATTIVPVDPSPSVTTLPSAEQGYEATPSPVIAPETTPVTTVPPTVLPQPVSTATPAPVADAVIVPVETPTATPYASPSASPSPSPSVIPTPAPTVTPFVAKPWQPSAVESAETVYGRSVFITERSMYLGFVGYAQNFAKDYNAPGANKVELKKQFLDQVNRVQTDINKYYEEMRNTLIDVYNRHGETQRRNAFLVKYTEMVDGRNAYFEQKRQEVNVLPVE